MRAVFTVALVMAALPGTQAMANFPLSGYFSRVSCGVKGQWSNFQECQRIRKQQRLNPDSPLTFAETQFLKTGVDDRWKLFTLGLYYNFSPEMVLFITVIPSFWPRLMPSMFQLEKTFIENWEDSARRRVVASVEGIKALDEQYLRMKRVGRTGKKTAAMERVEGAMTGLRAAMSAKSKDDAVKEFLPILQTEGKKEGALDLGSLPKPLVKAVSRCVGIEGFLLPGFMRRGKLKEHLRHVKKGDVALFAAGAGEAVQEVPRNLLLQACSDRGIGSPDMPESFLRDSLTEYLKVVGSYEGQADGNRMRLLMIGLNTMETARVSPDTSILRGVFAVGQQS